MNRSCLNRGNQMENWNNTRYFKLLLIPIFIFIASRLILLLFPSPNRTTGETLLWLVLMLAPLLAFVALYAISLSRVGRRPSVLGLVLIFAGLAACISVLLGATHLVSWFGYAQSGRTAFSKFVVRLLADPGWLFPSLILLPFFAYLLYKWKGGWHRR
jgi:hypothetical protein